MKNALTNEKNAGANIVWVVYNHMPNGHVVVRPFIDEVRKKKVGGEGETKDIKDLAVDQVKGFIKSDFVALHQNGKLEKNKVLVYDGNVNELRGNPQCHAVVHAWAEKQGVTAYLVERPKAVAPVAPDVENRLAGLESGQKSMADALQAQAAALNNLAAALASKK
jgi:hypothetical protein